MSILKLENGVVKQVWHDAATLEEFLDKYDLSGDEYVIGESYVGQVLVDGEFVNPSLPDPSTNPRDYTLTKPRWRHMARAAGFWTHIKTVEGYLEINDHAAYADLMETLEGNQFKFDATLAQITSFAPLLPDVELPNETALSDLWIAAAAR